MRERFLRMLHRFLRMLKSFFGVRIVAGLYRFLKMLDRFLFMPDAFFRVLDGFGDVVVSPGIDDATHTTGKQSTHCEHLYDRSHVFFFLENGMGISGILPKRLCLVRARDLAGSLSGEGNAELCVSQSNP